MRIGRQLDTHVCAFYSHRPIMYTTASAIIITCHSLEAPHGLVSNESLCGATVCFLAAISFIIYFTTHTQPKCNYSGYYNGRAILCDVRNI